MIQQYPFTIGEKETWIFRDFNGVTIELVGLKSNDYKRDEHKQEVVTKDGTRWVARKPRGYSGSFIAFRGDSTLEDFFISLDQAYQANSTLPLASATRVIQEGDGSTTMYALTGVTFGFSNMGEFDGDKMVEQHVEWDAQTLDKIS